MPAYVVAQVEVLDPERFRVYQQLATASVEKFGGRFVVRGGSLLKLEGDWDPTRVVVVEFPSLERIERWYRSPEYVAAIEARKGAAVFRMIGVEGQTTELAPRAP
jgi:uncharacterized protein (DUF1330 family)